MEVGIFKERKKSKNRVCCAVRTCDSKANKNLNVIFHKFPKAGERFVLLENFSGDVEKVDKLKAWMTLLKINKVTPQMKVCSLHFKKTDYILSDYNLGRKFLKKIAVPSYNLPESFMAKNLIENETRLAKCKRVELNEKQNILLDQSDMKIEITEINDIDMSAVYSNVVPVISSSGDTKNLIMENSFYDINEKNIKLEKQLHSEFVIKNELLLEDTNSQSDLTIEDIRVKKEIQRGVTNDLQNKNSDIFNCIKYENIKLENELNTELIIGI